MPLYDIADVRAVIRALRAEAGTTGAYVRLTEPIQVRLRSDACLYVTGRRWEFCDCDDPEITQTADYLEEQIRRHS